jgi:hypothetical protein
MGDARRKVPSVDTLLRSGPGKRASAVLGRSVLKRTITSTLEEMRARATAGDEPPPAD